MRLNRRVPVGTHGGVRGRLSIHESLLLDFLATFHKKITALSKDSTSCKRGKDREGGVCAGLWVKADNEAL